AVFPTNPVVLNVPDQDWHATNGSNAGHHPEAAPKQKRSKGRRGQQKEREARYPKDHRVLGEDTNAENQPEQRPGPKRRSKNRPMTQHERPSPTERIRRIDRHEQRPYRMQWQSQSEGQQDDRERFTADQFT